MRLVFFNPHLAVIGYLMKDFSLCLIYYIKTCWVNQWTIIYPMNSAVQPFNNWGQVNGFLSRTVAGGDWSFDNHISEVDHLQCQVLTHFQVVETLVITTKSTALLRTVSCHKKNSWINSICLVRHPLYYLLEHYFWENDISSVSPPSSLYD